MIFMIALAASGIVLFLMAAIAKRPAGVAGACFASAGGVVLFLLLLSPVLALQCLLICLAGIACCLLKSKPRTFILSAIGATVLSYACALVPGLMKLHERQELREEYPLVSVTDRLEYEVTGRSGVGPEDATTSSPEISNQVTERLKEFEERRSKTWMRRFMLESVHQRKRDQFVITQGFGRVRMLNVRRERIELPEPKSNPLPPPPEADEEYDPDEPLGSLAQENIEAPGPSRDALFSLHRSGLLDFLHPGTMGYVKDREHVAGFLPHHFREIPRMDADEEVKDAWQITRLELIGLLSHETPVAYVSRNLPQMEELKDAPTRPLDGFEKRAIGQLRTEEDVVVEDGLNQIRMVGSLRAGKGCTKCHFVERGELLGAFSYDLHRVEPIQRSRKEPPAGPQAGLSLFRARIAARESHR